MTTEPTQYPCKHLKVEDAQNIWRLAEDRYAEDSIMHPVKSGGHDPLDRPAWTGLTRAVHALDQEAYWDLVALMWLGRGDETSYESLREYSTGEVHPNYVSSKGLVLHRYLRVALESFGVPPAHDLDEDHYRAPLQNMDRDGHGL